MHRVNSTPCFSKYCAVMKVVINNHQAKSSCQLYFEPPILFLCSADMEDTVEEYTPGVTAHKVHYDLNDDHLATYKVYLKLYDMGSPKETLEFLAN